MKKYAVVPFMLFALFGMVSCMFNNEEVEQIGEELTYPDELYNDSIEAALKQLKGWNSNMSSMNITISGEVNQNLLLKLKEEMNTIQVKVAETQKTSKNYQFLLNMDFSQISGVNSFYECYFTGCPILGSIKLPECFTEISKYTFYKCKNLKEITIPENVSEIGYNAFDQAGLENITIKSNSLVLHNKAFGSLNAKFIIDNSNGNKVQIENNLSTSESPFVDSNNNWYNTFHIDETYEGQDSKYKFSYSKSDDILFCNIEKNNDPSSNKVRVLVSYAKNYTYDGNTDTYNMDSPFDLSDIFNEDVIIAPKSMAAFENAGENCSILTGLQNLPEGKALYYSTSLSNAVNKYKSKKNRIDITKYGLNDYNDIYKLWSSTSGGYYLYIADL